MCAMIGACSWLAGGKGPRIYSQTSALGALARVRSSTQAPMLARRRSRARSVPEPGEVAGVAGATMAIRRRMARRPEEGGGFCPVSPTSQLTGSGCDVDGVEIFDGQRIFEA